MDVQRQDDQLEPIYNSSVPMQDVALKTFWERWTIETGGGRRSGRSVLALRHEDDDHSSLVSWPGPDDLFLSQNVREFIRILFCVSFSNMVKFYLFAQFLVDQPTHQIVSSLILLLI